MVEEELCREKKVDARSEQIICQEVIAWIPLKTADDF